MDDPKCIGAGGGWVAYRPEIKILDCSIRDGGLINDHKFDDTVVRGIFRGCVAAGVNYVELGYKASKRIYAPSQFGLWKFCDEDDLRRIVGDEKGSTKITVMADAGRSDYKEDILPKAQSVVDCVRVACYINQIPIAMDMIKDAHDKGYETMLQLMAVSAVKEVELREAIDIAAASPADAVYIVDSWGALYSEQVHALVKMYLKALEGTGKEVGFHGHNNQQLAFANTIEAVIAGANRLDATVNGIGRGPGNCPLELLIGFLHNPKFSLRPILQCCQEVIPRLAEQMAWGYAIPYGITGMLNIHPRDAIEMVNGDASGDIVGFYDRMMEKE